MKKPWQHYQTRPLKRAGKQSPGEKNLAKGQRTKNTKKKSPSWGTERREKDPPHSEKGVIQEKRENGIAHSGRQLFLGMKGRPNRKTVKEGGEGKGRCTEEKQEQVLNRGERIRRAGAVSQTFGCVLL